MDWISPGGPRYRAPYGANNVHLLSSSFFSHFFFYFASERAYDVHILWVARRPRLEMWHPIAKGVKMQIIKT